MDKKFQLHSGLYLKVLTCQLNTKYKDIEHNIKRAENSLSRYTESDQLDVILFPETVFTGYVFKDKEDVKPCLEEAGKGPTFDFCVTLAKRLKSYVILGYPELFIDKKTNKEHYYNSAYVVDREGKLVLNYRKHYLYEKDHRWAEEGDGFKCITMKTATGVEFKACVAICMDINPYEFRDNSEFKLADFCRDSKIDALFFLSAWGDHEPENNKPTAIEGAINYWLYRLHPLMKSKNSGDNRYERPWAFYCVDRVGKEDDTTFIGCSCTVKANPLELVSNLGKDKEGFLLTEVTL